jgi:hypothetical protein
MFFTGSGPDKVPDHSDLILRSHSASSIERFLSTTVVIHLRSGAALIVQVRRLRRLGRVDVCRRRLRMTRFSSVGWLRPQDHRCAVSSPHLRHPFIPLPSPFSPHPEPRSPFPMKIGRVMRLQTTIGQLHSPFLFSSCVYHQVPSINARRSIIDDLATII